MTREELTPILDALALRFPTLDIGPMLGSRQGSITPPGSVTKDGRGHRLLDGSLGEAISVFVSRSESGFLERLRAELGVPESSALPSHASNQDGPNATEGLECIDGAHELVEVFPTDDQDVWEGSGHTARLRARFRWSGPMPRPVAEYARSGRLPRHRRNRRWLSHSEARQSVLVHAVLRGWTYADIQSRRTDWPGFFASYSRYQQRGERRRQADWSAACRWVSRTVEEVRLSTHKYQQLTGGVRAAGFHPIQQAWLAASTEWVLRQWPRSGHRWTVLMVLQGLAWASVVKGELVGEVPVVGLGVRSLSIMCGMLPETTVAAVLRELRDLPGAPILRVSVGVGMLPDRYALTSAAWGDQLIVADEAALARTSVEPVHSAWRLLGGRGRLVFELVVRTGLTASRDVQAASGLGRTEFHETVAGLVIAGLLARPARGQLSPGPVGLDEFATANGIPAAVEDRKQKHKVQRSAWWRWLRNRFSQPELAGPRWHAEDRHEWWNWACQTDPPPLHPPESQHIPPDPWDSNDRVAWWTHHGVIVDSYDLQSL
ncbi:hypothetical protein [Nocardia suismassiliense]|uniref:hypothetical protein n=1 Tax=Nocardia suismassiliense TaxID=2077092 RepID=UPI00131EEECE|nr:hypothetical protein [Nocardia suismassiliense]